MDEKFVSEEIINESVDEIRTKFADYSSEGSYGGDLCGYGGNACSANKVIIKSLLSELAQLYAKLTELEAELAALQELLRCISTVPDSVTTCTGALSSINDSMGRAYKNEGVTLDEGKIDTMVINFRNNIGAIEDCINSINDVIDIVEADITSTKTEIYNLIQQINALDCHCGSCPECIKEAEEAAAAAAAALEAAAANQGAYEASLV